MKTRASREQLNSPGDYFLAVIREGITNFFGSQRSGFCPVRKILPATCTTSYRLQLSPTSNLLSGKVARSLTCRRFWDSPATKRLPRITGGSTRLSNTSQPRCGCVCVIVQTSFLRPFMTIPWDLGLSMFDFVRIPFSGSICLLCDRYFLGFGSTSTRRTAKARQDRGRGQNALGRAGSLEDQKTYRRTACVVEELKCKQPWQPCGSVEKHDPSIPCTCSTGTTWVFRTCWVPRTCATFWRWVPGWFTGGGEGWGHFRFRWGQFRRECRRGVGWGCCGFFTGNFHSGRFRWLTERWDLAPWPWAKTVQPDQCWECWFRIFWKGEPQGFPSQFRMDGPSYHGWKPAGPLHACIDTYKSQTWKHTCIHEHTQAYEHVASYMRPSIHASIHPAWYIHPQDIQASIHPSIHPSTHTHIHTYVRTYMHRNSIQTIMHAYIHTDITLHCITLQYIAVHYSITFQ